MRAQAPRPRGPNPPGRRAGATASKAVLEGRHRAAKLGFILTRSKIRDASSFPVRGAPRARGLRSGSGRLLLGPESLSRVIEHLHKSSTLPRELEMRHVHCVIGVAIALSWLSVLVDPIWQISHAQESQPRKLAFLTGINKYQHADLDRLEFAERDVEHLGELLTSLGYRVALLTRGSAEKKASLRPTRANIERELKRLLQGVTSDDLIVVGLAGHGLQPLGSADSFYCPLDANPTIIPPKGETAAVAKFPQTLVPITGPEGLLEWIAESGVGRKFVLIDACRNDASSGRGRGIGSDIAQLPRSTWVMLSCNAKERSFETEKLGGGHGVFFHYVLEGLKGKAKNAQGEVTWNQLADYVDEQVSGSVPRMIGGGAEQHPNELKNGTGRQVLAVFSPSSPVVDIRKPIKLSKPEDGEDVKGTPAPAGAVVLFEGRNLGGWVKSDDKTQAHWSVLEGGILQVEKGGSIATERMFGGHFKLHVEFRVPYLPGAKGQARGNSGVFVQGRFEVQILDSYGLQSTPGDCGALYGLAAPLVNACKAPDTWQSFDIEFQSPQCRDGKKVQTGSITVFHNDVKIHDHVKLTKDNTIGGQGGDPCKPGPIILQDHGAPVQFRNIWLLPLK